MKKPSPAHGARQRRASHALAKAPGRAAMVNGREKPILKGGFVEADEGENVIEWSSP